MKPYGLIRLFFWKYKDKGDCLEQGAQSKDMKMTSKSRQDSRRIWKKKERIKSKQNIYNELNN